MKKTLIALATVASLVTVSGTAFAQATISGFMAFGYGGATKGKTATGAVSVPVLATTSTGGLGLDTAEIYITASEDMGGGMKAGGTMGLGGMARGAGFYGTNYTMYVSNATGKLTLGSVKSGDYISSGLASSGVNYYDFGDAGNFGARSSRDIIALDMPVGPVTITLTHQEGGNLVGLAGGGEGALSDAANLISNQRLNLIGATYAAGAAKVNTQYFTLDNQVAGSESTGANTFRLSGNYNLGVATVGAGLQKATTTYGNTATNTGLSVAVPMGAVTLGVMMGSRLTEGSATSAKNGTQSSSSLNVSYALSKRTGVTGQYSSWDNGVGGEKSSNTLVLLTHSF